MFEFTSDYQIGISEIDKEHESLFQILNEAIVSLQDNNTAVQETAQNFIRKLTEYASMHFAHEEKYMEETNDPELLRQKREHAAFVQKIHSYSVTEHTTAEDVRKLTDYIVRWLFSHILSSDMMIGKRTASTKSDPFAFTSEYVTQIAFMDNEHKRLFEIIREVNDLISAEFLHDKYDEIIHILDELKDYTEKHFQHEEEYMESIGYPGLKAQQRAHAAFIDKLVTINLQELDDIDDNQQEYLVELINYLLDWLSTHILQTDCLIPEWQKEQSKE